ncbi:MAG: hypothetical protein HKN70_14105 [Gammaproteobacteria bacterium]|nr:hypothetical protein [Gammaproteobacteria bacterium]
MSSINTNLYFIDELLIKAGRLFVFVAIFAGIAIVQKSNGDVFSIRSVVLLTAIAIVPLVTLALGYAVRRREKRIVNIHRLVKQRGELPVPDLVRMTGFDRRQLRSAVALLNKKSVAGLIWDETTDSLRSFSLGPRKTLTHSQRCGSCGASVNVEVSTLSRAPELACPYCSGALDSRAISKLQNELHLQEGYQLHRKAPQAFSSRPAPHGKPFNWVLFLLLMMFAWPLGIIYAIRYAKSARHLEDLLQRDRFDSHRRF